MPEKFQAPEELEKPGKQPSKPKTPEKKEKSDAEKAEEKFLTLRKDISDQLQKTYKSKKLENKSFKDKEVIDFANQARALVNEKIKGLSESEKIHLGNNSAHNGPDRTLGNIDSFIFNQDIFKIGIEVITLVDWEGNPEAIINQVDNGPNTPTEKVLPVDKWEK